jgi:hypothetical protein
VPFYNTPAAQSASLPSRGTILFMGNYTFADANTNGISDAWEQTYFGGVSPSRTAATDTDRDGAADFAEFIAGTNPTNSTSFLRFNAPAVTSSGVVVTWQAISGRAYRIVGSSNAATWEPVTDWMAATSSNGSFTLSAPTPGAPYLFRLEVRP